MHESPDNAVAHFELDLREDSLGWSTAMHTLYDYPDTSVAASMSMLMAHKHPADLPRMHSLLRRASSRLEPYVYQHRIITASDEVKAIVVAAGPSKVVRGRGVMISGIAIDLTKATRGPSFELQPSVETLTAKIENLKQAVHSRDIIGQAKGVLMHAHRITGDAAFELLTRASQAHNMKLRDVADIISTTGSLELIESLRAEQPPVE